MQLRHAVNGLRLRSRGQLGSVVFKRVHGAIRRFSQPPRAAQINHPHAAIQRLRNPLARLLVRRGQKQHLNSALLQQLPRKRLLLQVAAALAVNQLRMNLAQRHSAARGIFRIHASRKHGGLPFRRGWCSSSLASSAPAYPVTPITRGLHCLFHDSSIVLNCCSTSAARRTSGQITSTVSSPATVPTTSGHSS